MPIADAVAVFNAIQFPSTTGQSGPHVGAIGDGKKGDEDVSELGVYIFEDSSLVLS